MPNGVVHWEIGGRDMDQLRRFYEGLFGWTSSPSPNGNYRTVSPAEGLGGGLMQCEGEIPPYVTVYVSVEDIRDSLARAEHLGGTSVLPSTAIPGVGLIALFRDPDGNVVGMLEPNT